MKTTLAQMRAIATGALLVCVIGMVACRLGEPVYPWLAWPRAFFEAGTVGALADWFAVVALFRRPMGLPIPHTAILPNNKERVATSLATFMESSFLSEEQLGPRFRTMDYAGFASRWLTEHADFLAGKAARFAPEILAGVSDAEMTALLAARARALVKSADLGPMAGEGLSLLVENGRDREIFTSLLKSAENLIVSHREIIRTKIREEIPIPAELLRNIPGLNLLESAIEQLKNHLASTVATRTIEKIQNVLIDAENDPAHPLWQSFDQRLREFINSLQTAPEMAAKISALQDTLAGSAVIDDFASRAWSEIKSFLLRDCESEDSTLRRKLREATLTLARQLEQNEDTRHSINTFLGEQVLRSLLEARPHARDLVISTVQKWDSSEMANRLESTVGPDLQFIRLNGTIIGGLIGVAIHAAFAWAGV